MPKKYFWVNQGGTHAEEVLAGCLWAPERIPTGSTLNFWESMAHVQPSDIIFVYANGNLRGYAVSTSAAAPMPRPYASGAKYLPSQGGRVVFCDYHLVGSPIPLASILAIPGVTQALSGGANAVLNCNALVAQKYLCEITEFAAAHLSLLCGAGPLANNRDATSPPLAKTTVQQLIDARLGQGKFRADLILAFGGECPITGLSKTKLLRASHIRRWCDSSNFDRLDVQNGLLLAAGVDAAFECGYVGFDASGGLLVRQGFNQNCLTALGIPTQGTLAAEYLTPRRLAQLAYHQKKFNL